MLGEPSGSAQARGGLVGRAVRTLRARARLLLLRSARGARGVSSLSAGAPVPSAPPLGLAGALGPQGLQAALLGACVAPPGRPPAVVSLGPCFGTGWDSSGSSEAFPADTCGVWRVQGKQRRAEPHQLGSHKLLNDLPSSCGSSKASA